MNNPLNKISAMTGQVSGATRAAVGRSYDTGRRVLKSGSYGRSLAIASGIGAAAGGVLGAGASKASGDRRMSRDVILGATAGALGGAGYALRGPGMGVINSMRGKGAGPAGRGIGAGMLHGPSLTGPMHGPTIGSGVMHGPNITAEGAAYMSRLAGPGPGGVRAAPASLVS